MFLLTFDNLRCFYNIFCWICDSFVVFVYFLILEINIFIVFIFKTTLLPAIVLTIIFVQLFTFTRNRLYLKLRRTILNGHLRHNSQRHLHHFLLHRQLFLIFIFYLIGHINRIFNRRLPIDDIAR